ncbi:MAG: hypothetical protein Q4F97_04445 [Bacteroidales bacterium]|nr:hypothetical protein [Bacteroidales bacterium]
MSILRNILLKVIILSNFFFIIGCLNEDFTNNPNDKLIFSTDTINFGTVFSNTSSTTKKLMVYNKNDKAIKIDNISILNGNNTGFRINVDGIKGETFNDVEISSRDSLFVFIEMTPKENLSDNAVNITDIISFSCNNSIYNIRLNAYSQDIVMMKGVRIDEHSVIVSRKPILIYDSLYIAKDVELEISAGTKLFMHDKAAIIVDGTLYCNGTIDNPIIICGERSDSLLSGISYSDLPGQWKGIVFNESSNNNVFICTNIKGMSNGIELYSINPEKRKIQIINSQIGISYSNLITAVNSKIDAYNSVFYCAQSSILNIIGGYLNFVHCTIANNYSFGSIKNSVVYISDYIDKGDKIDNYSVELAQFSNSIIWGKRENEILINSFSSENKISNYQFAYSLLKTPQTTDSHFPNNIYNENPLFEKTTSDYSFDFRLSSDSPAIGKAWNFGNQDCKYDIFGNLRDMFYDIGAYQYHK